MRMEVGLGGDVRKHRANLHHLIAFDSDDTELERYNMTAHRQGVQQAVAAFKELPWQSVRFYDKGSGILHTYKRGIHDEDPAGEVEPIIPNGNGARINEMERVAGVIGRVLHDGQRLLLAEVRLHLAPMQDMVLRAMQNTIERAEVLERQHENAMKTVHRLSVDLARTHAMLVGAEHLREYEQHMIAAGSGDDGDKKPDLAERVFEAMLPDFARAALASPEVKDPKPEPEVAPTAPAAAAAAAAAPGPSMTKAKGKVYVDRQRTAARERNRRQSAPA